MLIAGHDREFWETFMKLECFDPTSIEPLALDHWVDVAKQPGTLRGILETYRAGFKNAAINRDLAKEKLTLPVMTIGAPDFFGPKVKESVAKVTERITKSELYEECGHSLALEKPERLARDLIEFMLG
jgi:pimeloyl-ACP methyl ester carboxylesterase